MIWSVQYNNITRQLITAPSHEAHYPRPSPDSDADRAALQSSTAALEMETLASVDDAFVAFAI